jgi:hypothetical protein
MGILQSIAVTYGNYLSMHIRYVKPLVLAVVFRPSTTARASFGKDAPRALLRAGTNERTPMPGARRFIRILATGLLAMSPTTAGAMGRIADHPTRLVADHRMVVKTPAGSGAVPIYVSRDWSVRRADVTRAIVLVHGTVGRDVFVRMAPRLGAREPNRDTLLIAPQFLTDLDAQTHHLAPDVLRWRLGSLGNGADAVGPAAINPFEVLDAILTRLADRAIFPSVTQVVLAAPVARRDAGDLRDPPWPCTSAPAS